MPARKRARAEMEEPSPAASSSHLDLLRNMWQFANLVQFLSFFGEAIGANVNLSIEDYETELLSSQPSDRLAQLQLCLLRYVSSQKGLNLAMKDEYTRRQFQKRLPRFNPFGDEDEPESFTSFDAPTKVRVLYHLSCWTLINPHRIRERLPAGDDEKQWRVEPYGCDRLGRSYMVLDDNRLYRRTDPPPPPPPPKSKSKSSAKKNRRSAAHAHKRRRTGQAEESEADEEEATPAESNLKDVSAFADDDFGGATWECVAITLTQYKDLLDSFKKSKVEAELDLHAYLVRDCLPVILDLEEKRLRKEERRAHESRQVEMLTNAKRSSRIADRSQKQKEEELLHEQARQEAALKAAARKEETRLKKLEELQYQRAQGREQRLKEREERRITHETKLENLKNGLDEEAEGRKSERQRAVDMQKYQEELAKTAEEEQEWIIDCSGCGFHGVFRDVLGDGKDVVECEKCHAWEHQACLGITDEQAGQETFHFVCKPCHRKAAEASRPRFIIKLTSPSNAQKAAAIPTNGTSTPDAKHTGTSPPQPRPVMAQFAPPSFPPQDRYSMSQIKEPFNGPGSLSVAPSATPPLVNGHSEHSTDSSKPDGRYGIDRPNGHPAIMFQPLVSAYPPLTPSTVTSPNLAPEYAFQHQSSDYTLHQSTVERLPDQQMTSSVHTSLTSGKQPQKATGSIGMAEKPTNHISQTSPRPPLEPDQHPVVISSQPAILSSQQSYAPPETIGEGMSLDLPKLVGTQQTVQLPGTTSLSDAPDYKSVPGQESAQVPVNGTDRLAPSPIASHRGVQPPATADQAPWMASNYEPRSASTDVYPESFHPPAVHSQPQANALTNGH